MIWFVAMAIHSNPGIRSGSPVIEGTGILTGILQQRFTAGETIASLSRDYVLAPEVVEDAIRFELIVRKRGRQWADKVLANGGVFCRGEVRQ